MIAVSMSLPGDVTFKCVGLCFRCIVPSVKSQEVAQPPRSVSTAASMKRNAAMLAVVNCQAYFLTIAQFSAFTSVLPSRKSLMYVAEL
jgi:uncharacterized protein YcbX